MRGRVCLFCHPPLPDACKCDVIKRDQAPARIPDAHRHLQHALLELFFQMGLEATDDWILGPADDTPKESRVRWSENPELAVHLERHPTLAGLLHSQRGCQAVYDWAGVRVPEAIAFELHLIGWRDDVIALLMQEREVTVRQWYANAEARIRSAISLVDFPAAS